MGILFPFTGCTVKTIYKRPFAISNSSSSSNSIYPEAVSPKGLASKIVSGILQASETKVIANGQNASVVTVLLQTDNSQPAPGKPVFLFSSRPGDIITAIDSITNQEGKATFSVRSQVSGVSTYSALTESEKPDSLQEVSIKFVPGPAKQLVFAIQPSDSVAGAIFPIQPTLEIRDAFGNLVSEGPSSDALVTLGVLSQGSNDKFIVTKEIVASEGKASFSDLSIQISGVKLLRADINNDPSMILNIGAISTTSLPFNVIPDIPSITTSSIETSGNTTVLANGLEAVALIITLRDKFGNPCSGINTSLNTSGNGNSLTQIYSTTDVQGKTTATLQSSVAETKSINLASPVDMQSVSTNVSFRFDAGHISRSNSHSCVIVNQGLKCWGSNAYYELADGTNLTRLTNSPLAGLGA